MDYVNSVIKKNAPLSLERKLANSLLRAEQALITAFIWRRMCRRLVAIPAALLLSTCALNAAARHPLDPLTAAELAAIRTILAQSGQFSKDTKFEWIELEEPPKKTVKDYKGTPDFLRNASVVAIDF